MSTTNQDQIERNKVEDILNQLSPGSAPRRKAKAVNDIIRIIQEAAVVSYADGAEDAKSKVADSRPLDPKQQLVERILDIMYTQAKDGRHKNVAEAIASAWLEDVEKARREVEGKFRCDYCEVYQHPKDMRATYGSDATVTGRICDSCVQEAMAALTNKSKEQ